jgi:hypothetical protein
VELMQVQNMEVAPLCVLLLLSNSRAGSPFDNVTSCIHQCDAALKCRSEPSSTADRSELCTCICNPLG